MPKENVDIPKIIDANKERMESLEFLDLTICSTTLYKEDSTSKIREKLAIKFFRNASELGIRCVVLDGGSNKDFLSEIKKIPNIEIISDPSLNMAKSRQAALEIAKENKEASFFLWVEPEKYDLINKKDLAQMIEGLRKNTTDIVVPCRMHTESMPEFQAWIESRANKRAMEISGISKTEILEVWDLWFGPKMFNREGLKYFLNYSSELNKWDSIIKPVFDAYKDGKRISSVDVNYKYDASEKENEEKNKELKKKRIYQYVKILAELGDEFWIKKNKTL